MKSSYALLALLFSICMFSCQTEDELVPESKLDEWISFEEKGLPLAMKKQVLENMEILPDVHFNDQFGYYEVSINGDLSFVLSEDALSIDDVKEELSNDQLFTYKYYDQGEHSLLYQAVLPDGTEYMYHFVKTIQVDNRSFVMRSAHDSEHTLRSIKLLKSVINTIVPSHQMK